jgi:hypothetical protein
MTSLNATETLDAPDAPKNGTNRSRIEDLLADREGALPIWIRAPKRGPEHYSGLSRGKLYQLLAQGKIVSRSLSEPGQIKATRLFLLKSILTHIDNCGAPSNGFNTIPPIT